MGYRRFLAGGAFVLLPTGTRGRVFARQVSSPGKMIELHGFGAGSQQAPSNDFLCELIIGGRTLMSESFNLGFSSAGYSLPFIRFEAMGLLELFVTNATGTDSTISAHVDGYYVDRPDFRRQ